MKPFIFYILFAGFVFSTVFVQRPRDHTQAQVSLRKIGHRVVFRGLSKIYLYGTHIYVLCSSLPYMYEQVYLILFASDHALLEENLSRKEVLWEAFLHFSICFWLSYLVFQDLMALGRLYKQKIYKTN